MPPISSAVWPTQVRWAIARIFSSFWILLDQLDRLLTRAAAGAVGDRDVGRVQRVELVDGLVKLLEAGLVLRREELEGDGRLALPDDLVDPHGC